MLNKLRTLIHNLTNQEVTIYRDEALETLITQPVSIYPLTLAQGDYTITDIDGSTTTWANVTPIINEDQTITIMHKGTPIGHAQPGTIGATHAHTQG